MWNQIGSGFNAKCIGFNLLRSAKFYDSSNFQKRDVKLSRPHIWSGNWRVIQAQKGQGGTIPIRATICLFERSMWKNRQHPTSYRNSTTASRWM